MRQVTAAEKSIQAAEKIIRVAAKNIQAAAKNIQAAMGQQGRQRQKPILRKFQAVQ